MIEKIILIICLGIPQWMMAADWQQYVSYQMDIEFDVETHQYSAKQTIHYHNNSPDTLHMLYFHLYMNAFQPGSMMDIRSRTIPDPDPRVGDRILHLAESEQGFQKIQLIKQKDGLCEFKEEGTILSVRLASPILPESIAMIYMEYQAQVPLQIRRMGRDNQEGIDYSMAQWYPKLCVYDKNGWHTDPYISMEFYSSFGDYDVNITIDESYVLAATGVLANPNQVGHGYEDAGSFMPETKGRLTWRFEAERVHDFVWAADRHYTVDKQYINDALEVLYVYQKDHSTDSLVNILQSIMPAAFEYANKHFGQYPYPEFAFIQGGDGGMEYPMATLMTFDRSVGSFLGTAFHELLHAWYHGIIANNELKHAWMDEGFADYSSDLLWDHLTEKGMIPGAQKRDKFSELIANYVEFRKLGIEEPLSLHADHFQFAYSYYQTNYLKGEVFLIQLQYMAGDKAFQKSLLDYFDQWKFRHPAPEDFIRIVEKNANMNLDWYHNYWIHTTRYIDYAVDSVYQDVALSTTRIHLSNMGKMPMPIDVYIEYEDETWEIIHVPLRMMRGAKPDPGTGIYYSINRPWPWTQPSYQISFPTLGHEIQKVIIDPETRMADMDRSNNQWTLINSGK